MNSFDCASDPAAALSFNGVCTTRLIQAAIKNSVTRFIYFSTAHVYCSHLQDRFLNHLVLLTYIHTLHLTFRESILFSMPLN